MSRTNAKWVAIWVGTLTAAVVVGTLVGQVARQYFGASAAPTLSEAAQPSPIAITVPSAGQSAQLSSPVPSPVVSPVPVVVASPQARAVSVPVPVAVAAPTSVPAPAATAPPPPVPPTLPPPTPAPPPPAPPSAPRTILDERFADNRAGWPDDPRSTAWLADGAYRLLAQQPGQFVAVPAPVAESFADVSVSGTFRKTGGPPGGGYGLIVRGQGPWGRPGFDQGVRFYVLEVGDRGEVGIWRREEDRWVDLLPWMPSVAVRLGDALNELRVDAIGPQLTFLVNGTQVARAEDPTLDRGTVGVFVGGDLNEVVLERFVVQAPG